jgi:hypothetical protein
VASKWNGVWYILAFAGLAIAWDVSARQAAGFRDRWAGWRRSDAKWLPLWFGLIPAVVYTASWAGWFATPYGYNRDGAVLNNGHLAGCPGSGSMCTTIVSSTSTTRSPSSPSSSSLSRCAWS